MAAMTRVETVSLREGQRGLLAWKFQVLTRPVQLGLVKDSV